MQLPSPYLKILKWIHISFASIVLGAIATMLYLFFMKKISPAGARENYFIYILFDSIVTYSFYAIITTAFIYGIFTKWKFFLHYWIAIKWILAIFLFAMVWFGWGSAINGIVALTDGNFGSTAGYQEYIRNNQFAFTFTIGTLILVWLTFLISSLKPWGVKKSRNFLKEPTRVIISIAIFFILISVIVVSSVSLNYYRNIPIRNSDLSQLADGDHYGELEMGGFTFSLSVVVKNKQIQEINIINNRNSNYARHAEAVIIRIIGKQNANMAAITGATTSSKVLMKAVEKAIE
jgi:uncharacterized protein with FMN-binding domain